MAVDETLALRVVLQNLGRRRGIDDEAHRVRQIEVTAVRDTEQISQRLVIHLGTECDGHVTTEIVAQQRRLGGAATGA